MVKAPCIFVQEMESPLGPLTVASLRDGLCHIEFGDLSVTSSGLQAWAKKHMLHKELKENHEYTADAVQQLKEYFAGKRADFDLPVSLKGTPFQVKVWQSLRKIPYGETRSYKEIAQMIGNPKAVRAVGSANNQNPVPIIIPCHRVIGSSGSLVGYGGGLDKKEILLSLEKQMKIS